MVKESTFQLGLRVSKKLVLDYKKLAKLRRSRHEADLMRMALEEYLAKHLPIEEDCDKVTKAVRMT